MAMERQLYRRLLVGVLFVLPYIAKMDYGQLSPQGGSPKGSANTRKKYKVFDFNAVLSPYNSTSSKFIPAAQGEMHIKDVIWNTQTTSMEALLPLAIESMHIRLQRQKKIKMPKIKKPNEEQMKDAILKYTKEELNEIDPEWQIFILEISDGGLGVWPFWYMQEVMSPLLGWNRINYATRTTQNQRFADVWVSNMNEERNPRLTFDEFTGSPINFTAMILEGENVLDKGCRSIQRLSLGVREDIVKAIDEYMKENHPSAYEEASKNAVDTEDTSLRLSSATAHLSRPTDVRTFWNATICNLHCKFRNYISELIASIPQTHSHAAGIQTNTEVVGFTRAKGRNMIHVDYIRGMMTTKIIVLAQRDHWEGHSRLYEALVSGALVMSDPQTYWPHGTIDNKNIVVYNSRADLEFKILYYLDPKNEEERMQIGQRGREVALTHHREWQQAERLFLNDMKYRNGYGLANRPWDTNADFALSI